MSYVFSRNGARSPLFPVVATDEKSGAASIIRNRLDLERERERERKREFDLKGVYVVA
jgi:hypothetical protein